VTVPTVVPKQDAAKDIQVLESMSVSLSKDPPEPENPMNTVEKSLSKFVEDAFDMTRSEFDFQQQIQAHVLTRLDKFSENQLIALLSNTGVNSADKISKTMNPWVQLATARQQAQIAAESAERSAAIQAGQNPVSMGAGSIKAANESATKEVLQGISSLSQILEIATQKAAKKAAEAQEAEAAQKDPVEGQKQP
jgi:hypothetical protein